MISQLGSSPQRSGWRLIRNISNLSWVGRLPRSLAFKTPKLQLVLVEVTHTHTISHSRMTIRLDQNLLEVEPNQIHGRIFPWNKHVEIKSAQMDLSIYLPIYQSVSVFFQDNSSFILQSTCFFPNPHTIRLLTSFLLSGSSIPINLESRFHGLNRWRGKDPVPCQEMEIIISNHLMQYTCLHTMLKQLFYDLF